jgi:hypothetical protein
MWECEGFLSSELLKLALDGGVSVDSEYELPVAMCLAGNGTGNEDRRIEKKGFCDEFWDHANAVQRRKSKVDQIRRCPATQQFHPGPGPVPVSGLGLAGCLPYFLSPLTA